jgi:hypothetical protein
VLRSLSRLAGFIIGAGGFPRRIPLLDPAAAYQSDPVLEAQCLW